MSTTETIQPGTVRGGEFIPADPVSYCLSMAKFNDMAVTATFKAFRNTRTQRQNRAWHGIVVPIFMVCYGERYNHEAAHYTLLGLIHYDVSADINGKLTRSIRPSHNLSTVEFNELYQKAQQYMAEEYQMDVPDPDPEYKKWKAQARQKVEA